MEINSIQVMAIILQVLGVDGNLTDEEIDIVEKEAILFGLDDKDFKKVINRINKAKGAKDILSGINTFEARLFTLQEIFKVLYSKQKVSRLERETARWIGESFKLSEEVVDRLESIVKKMRRLSAELEGLYEQCSM